MEGNQQYLFMARGGFDNQISMNLDQSLISTENSSFIVEQTMSGHQEQIARRMQKMRKALLESRNQQEQLAELQELNASIKLIVDALINHHQDEIKQWERRATIFNKEKEEIQRQQQILKKKCRECAPYQIYINTVFEKEKCEKKIKEMEKDFQERWIEIKGNLQKEKLQSNTMEQALEEKNKQFLRQKSEFEAKILEQEDVITNQRKKIERLEERCQGLWKLGKELQSRGKKQRIEEKQSEERNQLGASIQESIEKVQEMRKRMQENNTLMDEKIDNMNSKLDQALQKIKQRQNNDNEQR